VRIKRLIVCIIVIIILLSLSRHYLSEEQKVIGQEIDEYLGVSVYYNGLAYEKSYGKHYSSDGYYYGQKWQCVEFVKRFYYEALHHRMPEVYGHAKDFFDPNLEHGRLNKERALRQYWNGRDNKPKVNDLLVFTNSKYGHVAIVSKVEDSYIEVVQQNIYGKPREKFKLIEQDGKYIVGEKEEDRPVGWLRK